MNKVYRCKFKKIGSYQHTQHNREKSVKKKKLLVKADVVLVVVSLLFAAFLVGYTKSAAEQCIQMAVVKSVPMMIVLILSIYGITESIITLDSDCIDYKTEQYLKDKEIVGCERGKFNCTTILHIKQADGTIEKKQFNIGNRMSELDNTKKAYVDLEHMQIVSEKYYKTKIRQAWGIIRDREIG